MGVEHAEDLEGLGGRDIRPPDTGRGLGNDVAGLLQDADNVIGRMGARLGVLVDEERVILNRLELYHLARALLDEVRHAALLAGRETRGGGPVAGVDGETVHDPVEAVGGIHVAGVFRPDLLHHHLVAVLLDGVVADDAEGDYTIALRNTRLTTTESEELITPDAEANVKVKANEPGDVKEDGMINVADVSALIQYLLTGDSSLINLDNADVNGDGLVIINDIAALINMLLAPGK